MSLEIVKFAFGPLQTNCFVVQTEDACWVIDPGLQPHGLVEHIRSHKLECQRILLTHGHGDHIGGVGEVKEAFPTAKLCCPEGEVEALSDPMRNLSGMFGLPVTAPQPDELLMPGQTLTLGNSLWQVLDTSGHTEAGVSFYCASEDVVITGDALFAGSIGRTDIPGGDTQKLVFNIRENLLSLPGKTRVFSGHGPETTIAAEQHSNPYL